MVHNEFTQRSPQNFVFSLFEYICGVKSVVPILFKFSKNRKYVFHSYCNNQYFQYRCYCSYFPMESSHRFLYSISPLVNSTTRRKLYGKLHRIPYVFGQNGKRYIHCILTLNAKDNVEDSTPRVLFQYFLLNGDRIGYIVVLKIKIVDGKCQVRSAIALVHLALQSFP